MARILIVEDEKKINDLLKLDLELAGHDSIQSFTGLDAVNAVSSNNVDMILLDVNLPDFNGFDLIKSFRNIPVIYLTAMDDVKDKIKGLNAGAEDYITKPFDIEELIARINVILKRSGASESCVVIGETIIYTEEHRVLLNGSEVELTAREFQLLNTLIENKNMTLSRTALLDKAWGMDFFGDERTVDVHIQRLRKKLNLKDNIKTVFKVGYKMEY